MLRLGELGELPRLFAHERLSALQLVAQLCRKLCRLQPSCHPRLLHHRHPALATQRCRVAPSVFSVRFGERARALGRASPLGCGLFGRLGSSQPCPHLAKLSLPLGCLLTGLLQCLLLGPQLELLGIQLVAQPCDELLEVL